MADFAEQAARLCKADLVTEMVGEFPELQGLMGGYYARAEGLPDEVADAIRDHYKPVGQGDEVPSAPVTVAVSLADKLDTLVSFFAIDEKPTGSKDPFALRRAAISTISLVVENCLRLPLREAIIGQIGVLAGTLRGDLIIEELHKRKELQEAVGEPFTEDQVREWIAERSTDEYLEALGTIAWHDFGERGVVAIEDFFADRLKVQQREAGVRHDLIDAVFALGGEDDLVRLLARVQALQAFIETEDGTNLLAGYKRAANILKKEGWEQPVPYRRPVPDTGQGSVGAAQEGSPTPDQVRGDRSW